MSEIIDPERSMECPRCGYDQHGVVSTWSESCPLDGTCTECGLEFRWVELMRPEFEHPRWCIELATGPMSVLTRAWKTFVQSFTPWRFWSRLQMHHPMHHGRLGIYVALLLAMVPALMSCSRRLSQSVCIWR